MKRKTLEEIVPSAMGPQAYRVCRVEAGEGPLPGLISYTCLKNAAAPFISRDGRDKLLFDNGFRVLSYLPDGEHWCLTCVYDRDGGDVEWYIDITRGNAREGLRGWYDDVYLDVVVLPDGRLLYKDEAELEAAVKDGEVSRELAGNAVKWRENLVRTYLNPAAREALDAFMRERLAFFEEKYIEKR